MEDDRLDRLLHEHGSEYNVPNGEPLNEMWQRIEAQLDAPRAATRPSRWRMFPIASGLAAAVLLGFAAGRVSSADSSNTVALAGMERADSAYTAAAPYRRAASRYLGQTAVLLLALESTPAARVDSSLTRRAGELLTTTRLLLDSPAATDPEMQNLISDLELVLAQINRLDTRRTTGEVEMIASALRERNLLPRIQSAVTRAGN